MILIPRHMSEITPKNAGNLASNGTLILHLDDFVW